MTTLKSAILVLFSIILLSSCITPAPVTVVTPQPIAHDFPFKPSVKEYTRKPIIEKKGNDFLVSDEFVENSVLLKKYSDKIDEWKKNNQVQ